MSGRSRTGDPSGGSAAEKAAAREAPRLLGRPAPALAAALLGGVGVSVQAYLNGQLGRAMDSAFLAAAVNNVVATVAMVSVVAASGALPRAVARVRAGGVPPAWHFLGGLGGAAIVLVSAVAAPEVGVALLTVAVVCGSTGGSLPVDAAGLGPAGRRPITVPRVAGAALAVGATLVAAFGARSHLEPLLLSLALLAGAGLALQSAANGQLASRTGEPFVAGLVNVLLGLAVLSVVALAMIAVAGSGDVSGNPWLYLGGLFGAFMVVVTAAAVQTLGVLRLGLAIVAGQSCGALAVDLAAPAPGEAVTVATVVGVVLAIVAVAVSGLGRQAA